MSSLQNTQAWKFAGLVQQRLTQPVDEETIAIPISATPGSQDWNGGVFTYVAPNGWQIRVGRVRNGVDRGGETWVDISRDGGKNWQRAAAITKEDECAGGKQVASVERPYMYGKMVNGEPWIVLGTCAAERGTKGWDIHEREAPLAHPEQLKTAPVRVALAGTAEYAYKDGVPIQSHNGKGIYLAATRHHIGGAPAAAVNADTVLCWLNEKSGRYELLDVPLERAERGAMDKTCNRISCELAFPDGSRFWGCDIRSVEEPNAALKSPLKSADPQQWVLGDFDEVTSFAVATWDAGNALPEAASVAAVLGRSVHPGYPTLRYLGIASSEAGVLLTYERASATGAKSTYQQLITREELEAALSGKGPQLILGQDPVRAAA
jgi:hypothetical protein